MSDWLFASARTDALLFATPSSDITASGIATLHTLIAQIEQQPQASEEKLKARESDFCDRLSAADERPWKASVSAKASFKQQSALEQEVASFRDQLTADISTKVDVESKIVSVLEELAIANDKIGRLRAELTMGRDKMSYNRQRASGQYSQAVHERLMAEFFHRLEVLTWKKHAKNFEWKLSATVDEKAQTHERNTEPIIDLAREGTRRSRVTDSRAPVVEAMNGFGTGVDGILVWMDEMMRNMQRELDILTRNGPVSLVRSSSASRWPTSPLYPLKPLLHLSQNPF